MEEFIGASLSEPHIDRDNGPRARKNGIYVWEWLKAGI